MRVDDGYWLLLLGVAALVGCPEPIAKRCGPSLPPCAAGEVCVAEICALADDAGSTAGGGMAGGGMAGGVGGGVAPCGGLCDAWAVCVANTCVPGLLTVTAPVEGAQFNAGQAVGVMATLSLPDGGPWPLALPMIPVTNNWGAGATTVTSGVAGNVAGRATVGAGVLQAGWATGTMPMQTSRNVSFVGCTPAVQAMCLDWQVCVPTMSGGQCERMSGALRWVLPADDLYRRGPVNPSFTAIVSLDADAGTPVPSMMPLSLADMGMLMRVTVATARPARYEGNVTLAAPEGVKTLVAGWPAAGGALVASRSVTWDSTAPTATLATEARPGTLPLADPMVPTSWVKDEVAYVRLTVSGATRAAQPSDVAGVGWTATALPVAQMLCSACDAGCVCFSVDLKSAPLVGLRGAVPVRAAAGGFVDEAGNPSAQQDADFSVTRVRWTRTLPAAEYRAAPTIDPQGNVLVGSQDAVAPLGTAGRVYSVHPADGGIRWTAAGGAVQALASARSATQTGGQLELVYVASNEDSAGAKAGRLRAVRATDGGVAGLSIFHCADGARPMFSAPSLVIVGGATANDTQQVGALGMLNTVTSPALVNGEACGYRPVNGVVYSVQGAGYLLPEPGTLPASPVNFASDGWRHFSVNSDFSGERWVWNVSSALATVGNLARGGSGPTQTGLAVIPTTADAGVLLTSQTAFPPQQPLGVVGVDFSNPSTTATTAGFTRASAPVVLPGASGTSWLVVSGGDDGAQWLRQTAVSTAMPAMPTFIQAPQTPTGLPSAPESLPTSPVYGSADQLYAVTRGRRLYVFSTATTGLAYAWDGLLPGSGDVVAHPTMDCNRTWASGAPGILYALTVQGNLTAVVVDSARLNTASPWPKWQRTAGNAGNIGALATDFPLNPGCPL